MTPRTLGVVLGLLGVVIFGATLPFTRLAVADLDPWFVTAGRAALSGGLAALVLLVLRRPWPDRATLARLALAAFCLAIAFPGLIGLAMREVDASHGGVVLGLLPIATAAASAAMTGERPSLGFWLAALAGAALVVGFSMSQAGGTLAAGDLYLAGAVAISAIGYVLCGQLAQTGRPGWEVISWVLVVALPVTAPAAFWLAPAAPAAVPASAWIGFAYVTLMSQYVGFFAWNAGLALGGIARVSQTQLLQTFVTLGVAALVNGEAVPPSTWAVAGIIVLLVLAAQRARASPPRTAIS